MSNELSIKTTTLKEIEEYGSNIQTAITQEVSSMLQKAKLIDLGEAGTRLQELSEVADSATKKGVLQKLPFMRSTKRWIARYESVESRVSNLGVSIQSEQEKLGTILDSLIESKDYLKTKVDELNACESELTAYIESLKNSELSDDDSLKYQAASRRLKVISTTNSLVKQEIAKSVLVIQENKEIQSQLDEACTNLIPMFNVMLMNTLASKANEEALKIKKALVKTANKMVIENAKQIERTADELIAGRNESLIDVKTIEEANKILQNTVKKVLESSMSESENNMQLVDSLKKSSLALEDISIVAGGK